jgi:hypothetical protein
MQSLVGHRTSVELQNIVWGPSTCSLLYLTYYVLELKCDCNEIDTKFPAVVQLYFCQQKTELNEIGLCRNKRLMMN